MFENQSYSENIFLYDKQASKELWDMYIDSTSTSYFNIRSEN